MLNFRRFSSRCALKAGKTPAVPVSSLSGEAQVTARRQVRLQTQGVNIEK